MKRALVALLMLGVVVLAGCGSAASAQTTVQGEAASNTPTSASIVAALEATDLPIGEVVTYDKNNDPKSLLGRPNQYVQKTSFSDTELDTPAVGNGTVEVFANAADAKAYVDGAKTPSGDYYYQSGPYVLIVSHDVTAARAKEYDADFLAALK